MPDLLLRTASELARMIRGGEASAEDVLEAHLRQIATFNHILNAVVTLDEEGARRRALEADQAVARGEIWGPLHGVPTTIKDCFETAGVKTTSGFPPLKRHLPAADATVVARVRAAGAIVIGKTNLSLLATDWQTNNPVFGRTSNPWDATRTCGGSSGGSAAAVSAGFSSLDVGSDIGGSIRVPAHFCGVYGLKPTEHRVPSTGHIPDWYIPGMTPAGSVRHMGVYGPLARSVEDLRLCFSVLAGPDRRQHEVPPMPVIDESLPPLRGLRLAWTAEFAEAPTSPDTAAALEKVVEGLDDEGVRIERIEPPFDCDAVWRTWGEIVSAEVGGPMPFLARSLLRMQFLLMRDRSAIRQGMLRGVGSGIRELGKALARRSEIIRSIDGMLDPFDAWICPVTPAAAFTHRTSGRSVEVNGRTISYFVAVGGYTTPFNLSGHPVVVLPVAQSSDGLPIGIQIVGHRWKDERLLALAATLDEVVGELRQPPAFRPSP